MTYLTRTADDRPLLQHRARRSRSLQDLFLTLTFFVSVAFLTESVSLNAEYHHPACADAANATAASAIASFFTIRD